jgi:hypothetical protein
MRRGSDDARAGAGDDCKSSYRVPVCGTKQSPRVRLCPRGRSRGVILKPQLDSPSPIETSFSTCRRQRLGRLLGSGWGPVWMSSMVEVSVGHNLVATPTRVVVRPPAGVGDPGRLHAVNPFKGRHAVLTMGHARRACYRQHCARLEFRKRHGDDARPERGARNSSEPTFT